MKWHDLWFLNEKTTIRHSYKIIINGNNKYTDLLISVLISRESTRPRATYGLSQLLSGRSWTLAGASLMNTCPTRRWCRAYGSFIMRMNAAKAILKIVARKILEATLTICLDPLPRPKTSTIWCSSAGGERRTRDRPSVKYHSFCNGKILDTLQHPDIEPSTSANISIVIPRIGASADVDQRLCDDGQRGLLRQCMIDCGANEKKESLLED